MTILLSAVVNIRTLLLFLVVCCHCCYHEQPKNSEIIDTKHHICRFKGAKTKFLDKTEGDSVLLYIFLLFLLLCC